MDFSQPRVMGIINCTPDSFYSGSRKTKLVEGIETALAMIAAGADILDLGGESSRPGSEYVDAAVEIERVIPMIEGIRKVSDITISVDTRKAAVARAALDAGADWINDISALEDDPLLGTLAAERDVPVILMHKRGIPLHMQDNPEYKDTSGEIIVELKKAVKRAVKAGIKKDKIILDPGIGFGKRMEDNLRILKELPRFKESGFPLLIGASRKAFIGLILEKEVEERLIGSVAIHLYAAIMGADIVRVHDVDETVQTLKLLNAVRRS
ncbi:MAG: dihydropteroate synthase [Spirochaetales bacterium]|nr:dihydropteroate synthase [Spirochaetales bacterium]